MSPTLFQRLLGAEFFHLADEVKTLHALKEGATYHGMCSVHRGTHLVARLACAAARLPPQMLNVPLRVNFQSKGQHEVWRRTFGSAGMSSTLRAKKGLLQEKIGLVMVRFHLQRIDAELHWIAEQIRLFGLLPLPPSWLAEVRCREFAQAGHYRFRIEARLPWVGLLIHYEGWLEPHDA